MIGVTNKAAKTFEHTFNTLCFFCKASFLFFAAISVSNAQTWGAWTRVDTNNANVSFGSVTATATVSNRVNMPVTQGFSGPIGYSFINVPGGFFTPPPTNLSTQFIEVQIGNALSTSTGSARITIAFSSPVTNPTVHWANLDNAIVDVSATVPVSGPLSITRVSGNNAFEVVGNRANTVTSAANIRGCQANDGTNPSGGCGSLLFNGTYSSIVFDTEDQNTVVGSDDGHAIGVSLQAEPPPPPAASVPALSWALQMALAALAAVFGLRRLALRSK